MSNGFRATREYQFSGVVEREQLNKCPAGRTLWLSKLDVNCIGEQSF